MSGPALLLTFFRYPTIDGYGDLCRADISAIDFLRLAKQSLSPLFLSPIEALGIHPRQGFGDLVLPKPSSTMLPALLMYLLGLMLARSPNVFFETWDLPLRIIAASAVMAVPTSLLALAYSALTLESRYAGIRMALDLGFRNRYLFGFGWSIEF